MEVSGRLTILSAVALAVAMAGGAWWYHYQASHRAAEFWGGPAAKLLVSAPYVEFLTLANPVGSGQSGPLLAGRTVATTHDLSSAPGLVHLRHALTQTANYEWDRRATASAATDSESWAYALRFGDGEDELIVLLNSSMNMLGKLVETGAGEPRIEALLCPRLAGPVRRYLVDVGVTGLAATGR